MRRPRGLFAAPLLLGVALVVLGSSPALAHTRLSSSSPAADGEVGTTPTSIVLTFTEPLVDLGTAIVVTGPDGQVQTGDPVISGPTVRQPVRPGAPAGDYTVSWRVVAQDGHPISGGFSFHAAEPGAAEPEQVHPAPAGPTGSTAGALPEWGWLVLVLAALATVAALAAQRVRQRR